MPTDLALGGVEQREIGRSVVRHEHEATGALPHFQEQDLERGNGGLEPGYRLPQQVESPMASEVPPEPRQPQFVPSSAAEDQMQEQEEQRSRRGRAVSEVWKDTRRLVAICGLHVSTLVAQGAMALALLIILFGPMNADSIWLLPLAPSLAVPFRLGAAGPSLCRAIAQLQALVRLTPEAPLAPIVIQGESVWRHHLICVLSGAWPCTMLNLLAYFMLPNMQPAENVRLVGRLHLLAVCSDVSLILASFLFRAVRPGVELTSRNEPPAQTPTVQPLENPTPVQAQAPTQDSSRPRAAETQPRPDAARPRPCLRVTIRTCKFVPPPDVDKEPGRWTFGTTCSVCIGDFEEGEKIGTLICGHYFHLDCIQSWVKQNPRCPMRCTVAVPKLPDP